MPKIPDEILYDVRLLRRHIEKGLLSPEDIERRRQAAQDMTEQAESIDVDALQSGLQNNAHRAAKRVFSS